MEGVCACVCVQRVCACVARACVCVCVGCGVLKEGVVCGDEGGERWEGGRTEGGTDEGERVGARWMGVGIVWCVCARVCSMPLRVYAVRRVRGVNVYVCACVRVRERVRVREHREREERKRKVGVARRSRVCVRAHPLVYAGRLDVSSCAPRSCSRRASRRRRAGCPRIEAAPQCGARSSSAPTACTRRARRCGRRRVAVRVRRLRRTRQLCARLAPHREALSGADAR